MLGATARGDEVGEARAHNEKAMAAFALERYDVAAEEYEKAFGLKPLPELLYNAAQSYRLAGKKERALRLYQSYLRVFPSVRNRAEVETHIANLQRAIESESRAATAPPVSTAPIEGGPGAKGREPAPPPPNAPAATTTAAPDAAPPPTAPRADLVAPAPRPLVRRPLFWVGVAGAVVVVAAAVVLGVLLGASPRDPVPTWGSVGVP